MNRYELNGVPLPYSVSSPLTSTLFPGLVAACKAQKAEDDDPSPSAYFEPPKSLIPACESCKGKRVFELQLVPSLINILRPHTLSTGGADGSNDEGKKATEMTEEERKEELEKIAKGEVDEGMEWGSILVFSCERDCVGVREEWVGVEWEAMLGAAQ
jgi:pre-rRNA-processing protein TSR4